MYDENQELRKFPEMLPVQLPKIDKFSSSGNPLDQNNDWKIIIRVGKNIQRETIRLIHLLIHLGIF